MIKLILIKPIDTHEVFLPLGTFGLLKRSLSEHFVILLTFDDKAWAISEKEYLRLKDVLL